MAPTIALLRTESGLVQVHAHRCDSKGAHGDGTPEGPVLATVRMQWVTGPVEYCAGCAVKMRAVAAALGMAPLHETPIAPPEAPTQARTVALEGLA